MNRTGGDRHQKLKAKKAEGTFFVTDFRISIPQKIETGCR
jgi:hypothetical protein